MTLNTRRHPRRGGVLVEMAFITCICVAFMFAIFEYGRIVMVHQIMDNAARAGCRAAVVIPTSYTDPVADTNQVKAVVTDQLAGLPLTQVNIQIFEADASGNNIGPWTSTPFGQNIVVQLDGDLPLMFPTFGFVSQTGGASNSERMSSC